MITIQHLQKHFGNKHVLNDINCKFNEGHVYGIAGENGAGKTTLFRCIAGLESYEGNIQCDREPLKNHLGFLTTDPYFYPKITGLEYIRFMCNARGVKVSDIPSRNIFELPLNQYASTYSTGMKKKLALTAILLLGNQCFVLDEPFNGVDIQSNMIITEIIHKLKSLNKTILIASHIFSTLSSTCDEILLLKDGRFIKQVDQSSFSSLEEEMKSNTIGDKIDKLGLI